jgi:hypothetical protein
MIRPKPAYDAFCDYWFKLEKGSIYDFLDPIQHKIFENLTKLNWGEPWKVPKIIDQLNGIYEKFGINVIKTIEKISAKNSFLEWTEISRNESSHTINDLIRLLWEPSIERGCEYTMEVSDNGVQMECTRCPYYDLAKEINGAKWIYSLWCKADPYIVEGFNPRIGFNRTKTLMQGHGYCNHFYFMKEKQHHGK